MGSSDPVRYTDSLRLLQYQRSCYIKECREDCNYRDESYNFEDLFSFKVQREGEWKSGLHLNSKVIYIIINVKTTIYLLPKYLASQDKMLKSIP